MKYVEVVQWTARNGSITLEMLGEDQEVHPLEVSSECAGVLAAALAAETEKAGGPGSEMQFIRPRGMQTGKTAEDEPMIFLTLKGGTELPLVFKPESLGVLISELESLRRSLQPGSQVRWT